MSRARGKPDPEARLARELEEDGRCVEEVRRWLRVAEGLTESERGAGLRAVAEQLLLARIVALVVAVDPEELRAKLRKDPRLLTALLNAFIRLSGNLRKDQAAAEEPLEAITPAGNEDLTERLKLL